jgi:predicted branched-subunit amino acid permease
MILIFTVTTWVVWIPGTAIIYSLPYPLQIPLFNLTLCFFVILVGVFSQKENRHK